MRRRRRSKPQASEGRTTARRRTRSWRSCRTSTWRERFRRQWWVTAQKEDGQTHSLSAEHAALTFLVAMQSLDVPSQYAPNLQLQSRKGVRVSKKRKWSRRHRCDALVSTPNIGEFIAVCVPADKDEVLELAHLADRPVVVVAHLVQADRSVYVERRLELEVV